MYMFSIKYKSPNILRRNIQLFVTLSIICLLNKFKYINIDMNILCIFLVLIIASTNLSIQEHMSVNTDTIEKLSSMYDPEEKTLTVNNLHSHGNIEVSGDIKGKNVIVDNNLRTGEGDGVWAMNSNKEDSETYFKFLRGNSGNYGVFIRNNGTIGLDNGFVRIGDANGKFGIGTPKKLLLFLDNSRWKSGPYSGNRNVVW